MKKSKKLCFVNLFEILNISPQFARREEVENGEYQVFDSTQANHTCTGRIGETTSSLKLKLLKLTNNEADWGKAEPTRGMADLFWPEWEEAKHDHNQADASS